ARAVAERLAIDLTEIDWGCSGGAAAPAAGPELARLCSTVNLDKAREAGCTRLATGCAACLRHLEETAAALPGPDDQDARWAPDPAPKMAARQQRARGVLVTALHEVIAEPLLAAGAPAVVTRPLTGLKAAAYYGCRAYRDAQGRVRPFASERSLERVIEAVGAASVPWGGRGECSGGYLTLSRSEIVEERTSLLIHEAREAGAEVIVVVCATCHFNLGSRPLDDPLPLLYLPQLVGLALGLEPGRLGLSLVDPARRLLRRLGIS
ncbi:MAG: hypothetical protein HY815_20320, partial [Candidatus Riflebacteria bacterium]|nr:hypothetical protein [Candidatus Riflebacteria bacterium]